VGGIWFAVKEAAVPAVIGFAVWASMSSKRPLVRQFLFNEQMIDVARVEAALDAQRNRPAFETLLREATYWLIASFLLSAALNFALARWMLVSPPGTPEFNAELGKMNALSWPVIVIPTMIISVAAIWRLLSGVSRLTGMKLEEMFHPETKKS
ncbi:MAG TPA: VC0807 family protein, partial [Candidatus Synoicihabitans sp.]|nr:VC0807 family protein [Candidatus Synoicihabitans sp.]